MVGQPTHRYILTLFDIDRIFNSLSACRSHQTAIDTCILNCIECIHVLCYWEGLACDYYLGMKYYVIDSKRTFYYRDFNLIDYCFISWVTIAYFI